jgi:hypothetical protein
MNLRLAEEATEDVLETTLEGKEEWEVVAEALEVGEALWVILGPEWPMLESWRQCLEYQVHIPFTSSSENLCDIDFDNLLTGAGGQPNMNIATSAAGMLFPPPGMAGFPGMEQLFLGHGGPIPGFHPGNFPGNQPFFHPLAGGMPNQFANPFRFPGSGGPMGRGMGRGFMLGGRGGASGGRGGRGRGRGEGQGSNRGKHHGAPDHSIKSSPPDGDEDKSLDNDSSSAIVNTDQPSCVVENDSTNGHDVMEDPKNGEIVGSEADALNSITEQSKNLISGQVS